ncbi:MAG: adenine deaminase [Bacteroidales bacterium]|nr:adenine deaminase [Bacteroidales bacterium]
MKIVKGNIVDIVNKRIFKGEVHFTNIIQKIVEKDVSEDVYIMPGFVNSHVHIESSMLSPLSFSQYALQHGTVAIVTDPHEIANVCGIDGINFMINDAKQSLLKIFFTVPSCVPATNFETSGAIIDSNVVDNLLQKDDFVALSEMMNFPGVIFDDPEVKAKINYAKNWNKPIDGHAPKLSGNDLIKYISAGITTDHECSSVEEAIEKIKHGMKIQIREGSAAKNFESLYHLIDLYPNSVMLCTDDSHPNDLINGHINQIVSRAFQKGLNYFNVLRAASFNAIKHYRLNVGLLQLNDPADFIICHDMYASNIIDTYINGISFHDVNFSHSLSNSLNRWNPLLLSIDNLIIPKFNFYHVIECLDGELLTNDLIFTYDEIFDSEGHLKQGFDKIIVLNRYVPSSPVVALIKGINLHKGAFGSTVAHDSHNIIIVGHDDDGILEVFNILHRNKGGLAATDGFNNLELALPIAGLMSSDDAVFVSNKYHLLESFVKNELGSNLTSPFMTLSFMSLLVIPELKIGDKGLFNINKLQFVSLGAL